MVLLLTLRVLVFALGSLCIPLKKLVYGKGRTAIYGSNQGILVAAFSGSNSHTIVQDFDMNIL